MYYNNRGLAFLRMEKNELCFQDFDMATKLNSHDPNYFFNRGNAYLTVKNVEQVYECMYACMYACMYVCMDGWMDVCIYIYIYIYIWAWTRRYLYTHTHTHTHTHTQTGTVGPGRGDITGAIDPRILSQVGADSQKSSLQCFYIVNVVGH